MSEPQMMCRLCLSCDSGGVDLFERRKGVEGSSYSDQLIEMFQIELKMEENWSSVACEGCLNKLELMKVFKGTILSAQETFSKIHCETVVKCETLIIEEHIGDGVVLEELPKKRRKTTKLKDPPKVESPKIRKGRQKAQADTSMPESSQEAIKDDPDESTTPVDNDDDSHSDSSESAPTPVKRQRRKRIKTESEHDDDDEEELEDPTYGKDTRKSRKVFKLALTEEQLKLEEVLRSLKLLNCVSCLIQLPSLSALSIHGRREHNTNKNRGVVISCCDRKFEGTADIYDHMKYHVDDTAFKCPECGRLLLCGRLLKNHMIKHASPDDWPFRCDPCGKGFTSLSRLNNHNLNHTPQENRKCSCPHCDKKFLYPSMLEGHIKSVHEKDESYVCELCGKGFASRGYLRQHLEAHDVKQSTECDICGKQYLKLEHHKRRMHSDQPKVTCEICGKEYPRAYIRRHMHGVHSGNKAYECTMCGRAFSMDKNLKTHMDIHLGIKYQCFFCDHQSTSVSNRTKHHMQRHPDDLAVYRANLDKQVKVTGV